MPETPRLTAAVELERTKLERIELNIATAVATGRISERDGDERIARARQATANRVAFLRSEPRPRQRQQQPLDDPSAGRVS